MTEVASNERGKELSQQRAAMSDLPQHRYNLSPATEITPKGLAINGNKIKRRDVTFISITSFVKSKKNDDLQSLS